jgi:hypothetical protein
MIVQSNVLAGKIKENPSKALVNETYGIMQNDHVSRIAQDDPLIVSLGNNMMLRNYGNTIMRKYYTSSVMRLAAKFKMELQKLDKISKESQNLDFYLQPKYFDDIVLAALKCSKQCDEEDLKSPSNAIKLGYDIKRMASAKLERALMEDDGQKKKEADEFLRLMNLEWSLRVNKLARMILAQRSFNQNRQLPLPDDVQKLVDYLLAELKNADTAVTTCTYDNFRKVALVTLARITLYNRRRCHEVQALT